MSRISGRKAALILGISPALMSKWVKQKKLVPVEIIGEGDMFLFEKDEIEKLAADRREAEMPRPDEPTIIETAKYR